MPHGKPYFRSANNRRTHGAHTGYTLDADWRFSANLLPRPYPRIYSCLPQYLHLSPLQYHADTSSHTHWHRGTSRARAGSSMVFFSSTSSMAIWCIRSRIRACRLQPLTLASSIHSKIQVFRVSWLGHMRLNSCHQAVSRTTLNTCFPDRKLFRFGVKLISNSYISPPDFL
mgnify:CR=1 FL=1